MSTAILARDGEVVILTCWHDEYLVRHVTRLESQGYLRIG